MIWSMATFQNYIENNSNKVLLLRFQYFLHLLKGLIKCKYFTKPNIFRGNSPELFLGKGLLKICRKFTEQPCWNGISIKLLCNFIEFSLRHTCSPVNLLHCFRTAFYKNTSGGLLQHFRQFELQNLLVIFCNFW